jgi:hypothetical protein
MAAALPAAPALVALGPVGLAILGVVSVGTLAYGLSRMISDADDKAEKSLSPENTTEACSTCQPPEEPDDSKDQNKVDHIFSEKQIQKHKLQDFLKSFNGDKAKAYQALQNAARNTVSTQSGPFQAVVNVNGFNVTVRGSVMNGIARLSTAFIP